MSQFNITYQLNYQTGLLAQDDLTPFPMHWHHVPLKSGV